MMSGKTGAGMLTSDGTMKRLASSLYSLQKHGRSGEPTKRFAANRGVHTKRKRSRWVRT